MTIASFSHDCGCKLVRIGTSNHFELTESCNEHGGSLSFGGSQAAAPLHRAIRSTPHQVAVEALVTQCVTRSPEDRTFTFSEAEARRLVLLVNADHYDTLMERRKLVAIQQNHRDRPWTNRIAELDADDALLAPLVRKLQRRD